jgi:hypothetical protein
MTTQNRVNSGIPAGGQFANHDRAEAFVQLPVSEPQWTIRVKGRKVFTGNYDQAVRRADSEQESRPDVSVTMSAAKG